ncbi:MAG: hypothetical protein ACK5KR_03145 [Breznakia sp.]
MKLSIKHLTRTPVKLFFLIMATIIISSLFTSGIALMLSSIMQLNALEGTYTTIGMIEQNPYDVESVVVWDYATNTNLETEKPLYDTTIGLEGLDFKNIKYLESPKKLHYYGAFLSKYKNIKYDIIDNLGNEIHTTLLNTMLISIVEFRVHTPTKEKGQILIDVTKVYNKNSSLSYNEIENIYLDSSNLKHDITLEANKTYIMVGQSIITEADRILLAPTSLPLFS